MASEVIQLTRRGWGETMRRDRWWIQPLTVFIILSSFLVYATWAAFQNAHYEFGPYLSPFYSPLLFANSPHALIHGTRPSWVPGFLPFTPALLILPFPAGFRLTCYYYRGAYYKAFWADPSNCAVGEPRSSYLGERRFPLILQNVHRYFLYFALVFLVILAHDAYDAMWFTDPATGVTRFGIGVGYARAHDERDPARRIHARMSFAAPSRGRISGSHVGKTGAEEVLRLRELPQPRPHALGLDKSFLA